MATNPNYTKTPRTERGVVSAANVNRDGTGTIVTVFTANATFGSRIERITANALVTTTAGMLRFYIINGADIDLYDEAIVTAIAPSGTVRAFRFTANNMGLILAPNRSLGVSTQVANAFRLVVEGGDFDV